jgi:hypothetical protein
MALLLLTRRTIMVAMYQRLFRHHRMRHPKTRHVQVRRLKLTEEVIIKGAALLRLVSNPNKRGVAVVASIPTYPKWVAIMVGRILHSSSYCVESMVRIIPPITI